MTPTLSFPVARWIGLLALAETIGMTAAASASVIAGAAAATSSGASAVAISLAIVVLGGLVEGAALAFLPPIALVAWRADFRRRAWIGATVVVAGLGWALASLPSALASPTGADAEEPPAALVLLGAAGLGLVMGLALGAAQVPAFRGAVRRPWRWVGVSAAAWTPTMVVIFVGATLPDASWPTGAIVAIGPVTGALAGAVLGAISGPLMPVLEGSSVSGRVTLGILGSPLHGMLSGSLLGLRLRGRVTGRPIELPVAYRREGEALVVTVGRSASKRWWRNLEGPTEVEALLAGRWMPAVAELEPRGGLDPLVRIRMQVPLALGLPTQ